jgi:hypothetical protein
MRTMQKAPGEADNPDHGPSCLSSDNNRPDFIRSTSRQ